MRRFKSFILVIAILLTVLLPAAAMADSALADLWKAGTDFLFHTDNVTVAGDAVFLLDGTRFKTAQLDYLQDGYRSYYGLKLLTPKKDGGERETGWTIIADERGNIAVMEAYAPGTYKQGYGAAQNTLLRRSVQLDALIELGGLLAGQVESMLPEGAVTVSEAEGAKTVHIKLSGSEIPEIAASALNVAAGYLSDRWFSYSHDRSLGDDAADFENYITVTQALTDGTVKWTLQNADIEAVMDAQGRLSAVSGVVGAASTFWDGSVREVEIRFSLTMQDYGASHVKPFDPDDYHVSLPGSAFGEEFMGDEIFMDEAAWEEMKNRADALLQKQGYQVSADAGWGGEILGNSISLHIDGSEDAFLFSFTKDGSLLTLERVTAPWLVADERETEGIAPDAIAAADAWMRAFLADACPDIADRIGYLEPQSAIFLEDGSQYVKFHDSNDFAHFVVRVTPEIRVEYYYSGFLGD